MLFSDFLFGIIWGQNKLPKTLETQVGEKLGETDVKLGETDVTQIINGRIENYYFGENWVELVQLVGAFLTWL